jgi:hypothetical protein
VGIFVNKFTCIIKEMFSKFHPIHDYFEIAPRDSRDKRQLPNHNRCVLQVAAALWDTCKSSHSDVEETNARC